jgi:hypothetical protein
MPAAFCYARRGPIYSDSREAARRWSGVVRYICAVRQRGVCAVQVS